MDEDSHMGYNEMLHSSSILDHTCKFIVYYIFGVALNIKHIGDHYVRRTISAVNLTRFPANVTQKMIFFSDGSKISETDSPIFIPNSDLDW